MRSALAVARPDGGGGRRGGGRRGDLPRRDLAGRVAGVQLVQPAARADHRRPVRLSGWALGQRAGSGVAAAACWRRLRALLFLSAFSVVTLAMPLGATKLYLFGISVDQQFRTEYLTRLADSAALHDMTYFGLPPFYPPGWFWLGGRLAALTGHARVGDVQAVGDHLDHDRRRAGICVVGQHDSLRVRADRVDRHRRRGAGLLPRRALRRDHHRAAAAGVRAGLVGPAGRRPVPAAGPPSSASGSSSVSPRCSTRCCSAYAAFTLTIMALLLAVARGRLEPLLRLAVIAVIAGAHRADRLGARTCSAAINGTPADSGTAQHYLPVGGRASSSSRCCTSRCSARCACSARCGWWCAPALRPGPVRWPSRCSPSTRGRCCRC